MNKKYILKNNNSHIDISVNNTELTGKEVKELLFNKPVRTSFHCDMEITINRLKELLNTSYCNWVKSCK